MQTTFDNDIYELSDKFNKQINIENSAELANRRVALKKVDRNQHMEKQGLKRTPKKQVETKQQQPEYSQELMLQIENRLNLTTTSDIMVANMFECFGESPGNSKASDWREGHIKSAFNYVLIDPRVTCNLPSRAKAGMEPNEVLRAFIDAIFYIGKGSRARPYAHLHDTVRVWRHNENDVMSPSEKIPKKKCLYNYLAELRRKKYSHSNMTLGELSHWCHEHLDVPPENEPEMRIILI